MQTKLEILQEKMIMWQVLHSDKHATEADLRKAGNELCGAAWEYMMSSQRR
jgi:hypothetical protein